VRDGVGHQRCADPHRREGGGDHPSTQKSWSEKDQRQKRECDNRDENHDEARCSS
jgi:hypothetical protein